MAIEGPGNNAFAVSLTDLPIDRIKSQDPATSSSSLTAADDELTPLAKRQRSLSVDFVEVDVSKLTQTGEPVQWDGYLSQCGAAMGQPSLRAIVNRFSGMPGVIGLHAGLPAAEAFPITNMSYTLRDGTHVTIDDPATLTAMQQYSISPLGHPPLAEWAAAHTQAQHSPPAQTTTAITIGSNAGLEMLCTLLLERGDGVLTEAYTYSHLIESTLKLHGRHAIPVAMDAVGMQPEALCTVLQAAAAVGGRQPRVLYTVPTGQNPTGSTVPLERKQEIYAICREYGLVIIEDDPYYYLQFPDAAGPRGLDRLERSYLSIDTDGRVVRLDSFAKFLAPGLRLGWATGAPAIVQKLAHCVAGTSLGACATTQVIVMEMLRAWGDAGLRAHVATMQLAYARRAAVTVAAAEQHLSGLASWRAPEGGMFLWIALGAGVTDADEILDLLAEHRVVVVPGRICHALGPRPPMPCPFVRVSFSLVSEPELEEAMARLGQVLRSFPAKHPAAGAAPAAAAGDPVPPGVAAA